MTDAQYRQYKLVEDAISRSGDQPGGFTPAQLSAAVRAATPKAAYGRGAGGPLRELAAAGRQTMDQRSPPTGQRLAALGTAWMPWLLNTAPGKAVALGETRPQRWAALIEDWAAQNGLLEQLQRQAALRTGAALAD